MDFGESEQLNSLRGGLTRRKSITLSKETLVECNHLCPGDTLPLVIRPKVEELDLVLWAKDNLNFIESKLLEHGGLLLRDFPNVTRIELERFASTISPALMNYDEPSTPRVEVGTKIYTSTEYPADQPIPLHNELSYGHTWPMKVWFYCEQPALQQGETPIADSRKVLQLIPPEIREQFCRKGVRYVRSYGAGVGLPWQEVFRTSDKKVVEQQCIRAGVGFEWKDSEWLMTSHSRPAVATHPKTGETVWFNQAHVHHVSSLQPAIRESLLSLARDTNYPLDINACYGDGFPIEDAALDAIREAYRRATIKFPWQRGDILMLDNMLVAHGRQPFVGPRKILVAMAEPRSET